MRRCNVLPTSSFGSSLNDAAALARRGRARLVHERGIEPHIPVFDKPARTERAFDGKNLPTLAKGDVYFCA